MNQFSNLPVNLELSLDGDHYYTIDELNIPENEMIIQMMTCVISQLEKFNSEKRHLQLNEEKKLYLRLKQKSTEKYDEHICKQKKLYDSLTAKEKTILCFIGRGH